MLWAVRFNAGGPVCVARGSLEPISGLSFTSLENSRRTGQTCYKAIFLHSQARGPGYAANFPYSTTQENQSFGGVYRTKTSSSERLA